MKNIKRRQLLSDQPPSRIRKHAPLLILILFVGAFHSITMPKYFYNGDNFTPRAEASGWLMTGQLGLPYAFKQQNRGMFLERGQYLFENDAKQRLFPKYGIAYTLLYVPVMEAERLWTGKIDWIVTTQSLLVFLNIYNVLFTIITAAYLYFIAGLYAKSLWPRVFFILPLFYCTYVWHYLRAPALEIFQIVAFVGYCYHSLRFIRDRRTRQSDGASPWLHIGIAVFYSGALVLMKPFFALLLGILGAFALFAGHSSGSALQAFKYNLSKNLRLYLAYFALPLVIMMGVWLAVNHYRFGSIFNLGYSQWVSEDGRPHDRWGLEFFLVASGKFLFQPGNANVFIHNPVFFFALAGWPLFIKKHRIEALFMLVILLSTFLTLCFFSVWHGEWCYGPRYLLHPLIIGSIPILSTWTLLAEVRSAAVKWGGRALIGFVLFVSLLLQIQMNSLTYFEYYDLRSVFDQFAVPEINAYFNNSFSRALISSDVLEYERGQAPFFPLEVIKARISPQQNYILPQLTDLLRKLTRPNYLFFP
jgi:hypothetical protein